MNDNNQYNYNQQNTPASNNAQQLRQPYNNGPYQQQPQNGQYQQPNTVYSSPTPQQSMNNTQYCQPTPQMNGGPHQQQANNSQPKNNNPPQQNTYNQNRGSYPPPQDQYQQQNPYNQQPRYPNQGYYPPPNGQYYPNYQPSYPNGQIQQAPKPTSAYTVLEWIAFGIAAASAFGALISADFLSMVLFALSAVCICPLVKVAKAMSDMPGTSFLIKAVASFMFFCIGLMCVSYSSDTSDEYDLDPEESVSVVAESEEKTSQTTQKNEKVTEATEKATEEPITESIKEPIVFSGTGDSVTEKFTGKGLVTLTINYSAKDEYDVFSCDLYDSNGEWVDWIVTDIGDYSGQKVEILEEDKEYLIEISADGDWQITIE